MKGKCLYLVSDVSEKCFDWPKKIIYIIVLSTVHLKLAKMHVETFIKQFGTKVPKSSVNYTAQRICNAANVTVGCPSGLSMEETVQQPVLAPAKKKTSCISIRNNTDFQWH